MKHVKLFETFIDSKGNLQNFLKQSPEFEYNGYVIKTNPRSHTQGSFDVYKGKTLIKSGFDLEAPYDKDSLTHSQNDGRENPYFKTDDEIKAVVDEMDRYA